MEDGEVQDIKSVRMTSGCRDFRQRADGGWLPLLRDCRGRDGEVKQAS